MDDPKFAMMLTEETIPFDFPSERIIGAKAIDQTGTEHTRVISNPHDPQWYRKEHRTMNHLPDPARTPHRKVSQFLSDQTNPQKHQKCLFGNGCKGSPVKGHLVPENYMKILGPSGQMKVFTKHRFAPEFKKELPMRQGRGVATVGYFTCQQHEQEFADADKAAITTEVPPQRTLDLMALRGILHTRWWNQLWANASEKLHVEFGLERQLQIAEILRRDDNQLLQMQTKLERSLYSEENSATSPILHLVLAAECQPVIAAARFGIGSAGNMAMWGITLIPRETHTALCVHFNSKLATAVIDAALPGIREGRTVFSGWEITQAITSTCDHIVFSEETWRALPEAERRKVVDAYRDEQGAPNLFGNNKWRIIQDHSSKQLSQRTRAEGSGIRCEDG